MNGIAMNKIKSSIDEKHRYPTIGSHRLKITAKRNAESFIFGVTF